jgi:uncharacterized protein YciI
MRFAYFYFMTDEPERAAAVAPEHVAYWRGLSLGNYLGGPFGDRSGGLITFEAASPAEAEQLISHDPFRRERLVDQHWLKHWLPG